MKCPDCGYGKCSQVGLIRVPESYEVNSFEKFPDAFCYNININLHSGMDIFEYFECDKCNNKFLGEPQKPPCEYCGYCKKAKEMYEMRNKNEK